MPGSMERSKLHVEGQDDDHSVKHLLRRHGIDIEAKTSDSIYPVIHQVGSVEKLLEGIEIAVKTSTERTIGFVLDADAPILSRWESVRQKLSDVGVEVPTELTPTGFIGESPTYRSRVGVWLMPDNQSDGILEDFLLKLIDQNEKLIGYAINATDTATQHGATYRKVDRSKAVVHTWLAWQKEPGRPYGTAIRAEFFRHDTPCAIAFVQWFRRLYGIT
ncbi:MAG: hypothetical protein EXS05_11220 [Planctomycetaceae bacterium]|nr:hypothetical protein [Planctomycetaceae bacterium]